MSIIIQKLANVVNIIDDTRPAGSQIVTSIKLSSTAKLQFKGGAIPNVVQIWDSNGNQTANIEIAPDLQTQDEGAAATPWIGTDDELINKLNNEYFTESAGGGGGAVDATIVADNVRLAKEAQFNCKYTGFVIDLENPDSGTWPDYTFNIEQINFTLNVSPAFELSDFSQTYDDIRNTKELAEYLNCIQNYFYFVEVSPTLLGIMAGKLPVSEFNLFELNASGDILEYSSGSLQYQTATEEFSTQDKLVLTLEQNAHKQNAPKGLATRREELLFPGGGLVLSVADLNPYREELIIKNTSATNTLYIGYGSSTSETSYTWILQPEDIVTLTAGHRVTGAWETGSTSGTILITESI